MNTWKDRVGRWRVAISAGVLALIAGIPEAQAQVSDKVYEDFKSVVEELISRELAQSVVPNMMCKGAPGLLIYYPSTMQRVYDRQFGSLKAALQEETAEMVGSLVYDAITTGAKPLRVFLNRQPFNKPAQGQCSEQFRQAGGPAYFLANYRAQVIAQQKENLAKNPPEKGPPTPQSVLEEKCTGNLLTLARARTDGLACAISISTREALANHPQAAEEHLRQAISFLIAERAGALINSNSLLEQLDEWLAQQLVSAAAVPPPASLAGLSNGERELAESFRRQWRRLTSQGQKVDPLKFLEVILDAGATSGVCQSGPWEMCRYFPMAKTLLQSSYEIRRIVASASKGDARSAASEAMQAAFSLLENNARCDDDETPDLDKSKNFQIQQEYQAANRQPPDCDTQNVLIQYGNLLSGLASYVIESENKGQASDATRLVLRNAAFDLLNTEGSRVGFKRNRVWSSRVFIPQAALRLSVNPGYINESGRDSVRYVATLDSLSATFRLFNRESGYAALNLSLLDLIAPVSELALRKQSIQYKETQRLLSTAVQPRLQVFGGIPWLSTHLALAGGVSYRGAAAFLDDKDPTQATYRTPFTSRPEGTSKTEYYLHFAEVSLGLVYMP